MTGKEFLNVLANGQSDIVQILLDIIAETASPYCVIGGLAVNAYVEPVVSLDVDIVIILKSLYKSVMNSEFEFDNNTVDLMLLNLLNSFANITCSGYPNSSFV